MPDSETPLWTESIKFHSYDVDFNRRATVVTLCRAFLDAAWNHAELLGVGFTALEGQGKLWVLSRLLLVIRHFPQWGAAATLRTWPRSAKSVFAMREFDILDPQGTVCVAGTSGWLVLDAASKRPQRIQKLIEGLGALTTQRALDRDPDKIAGASHWAEVFTVPVRYSDIDVNRHVNSAQYISWMLDAYPLEFHRQHQLRELEVNYLNETRAGEVLTIRTAKIGAMILSHSIVNAKGDEVCRARFEWTVAEVGTEPVAAI